MKNFKCLGVLLVCFVLQGFSVPAIAAEESQKGEYNFNWLDPDKKIYVLQNRKYLKTNRVLFSGMTGVGTSNAYRKVYNFDFRMAYSFSEEFGIEGFFQFSKNSVVKIYSPNPLAGSSLAIIPKYEGEMAVSGDILEGEFNLDLPSSWTIAKTVDLGFITKLAGFEYSKHINLQDEGEVPVIRAQNVKPNRIDETKLKYIDLETSKLLSRCELVKESLLITFIGAGIGEVAVFRKKKRWHLAPNVAKLEPFNEFNHNIEIDYLLFYLLSPIGRRELFKHMKSTAQPSLSMGTIRDIIVCLPPIEEQKAIVEKVNALMGLCDGLAQEVQQSQEHSELLMQSVLRAIFEEK